MVVRFSVLVLFFVLCEGITNFCPTTYREEERQTGKTFWLQEPIYKTINVYTYIICKNLNLTQKIKTDNHGREAIGLKMIDLKNTAFPKGMLESLGSIQELYLNDNHLESIDSDAFVTLKKLQKLYLQNNNLTRIDSGILTGLLSLSTLDLSNNSIYKIDNNTFMTSMKINNLNLSRNHLENITKSTFGLLQYLIDLNLSHNNISELQPDVFHSLFGLTKLYLNDNNIKAVPKGIFNRSISVEIVDFSNNQINAIDFSDLQGFVNLRKNQIREIASKPNQNILGLNLGSNNLTSIPQKIFNKSANLVELNLSNNIISNINDESFAGLKSLRGLQLDRNKIRFIPLGTFRELRSLISLNLSTNQITYLEYGSLSGLSNLTILDISHNRFSMLEIQPLYPIQKVQMIKLGGNVLTTLNIQGIIENFSYLRFIQLDRNNWMCDWLMNTLNMFKRKYIRVLDGDSYKTTNINGIYCMKRNYLVNNTNVLTTYKPTFITPSISTTNRIISSTTESSTSKIISTLSTSTSKPTTKRPTTVFTTTDKKTLPPPTSTMTPTSPTLSTIFFVKPSQQTSPKILNLSKPNISEPTIIVPEVNETISRSIDSPVDINYAERLQWDKDKESTSSNSSSSSESKALNISMYIVMLFVMLAVILVIINQTHTLMERFKNKKEKPADPSKKYIKKESAKENTYHKNIPVCWVEKE